MLERTTVPTTGAVRVGHDVITTVTSAATDRAVGTVVLPHTLDETSLTSSRLTSIAARARCDVVTVRGDLPEEGLASVLVPVAGGPHSGLAVDVSRALAATEGAWSDLLHVIAEDTDTRRADARSLLASHADRFGDVDHVTTWVLDSTDVAGTIREQSRYYDLTLIGAPRASRLNRFVFGSTTSKLRDAIRSPLAVVHRAPDTEVVQ